MTSLLSSTRPGRAYPTAPVAGVGARLLRPSRPSRPSPSVDLDPAQRRVVEMGRGTGPVVVLGAPGTGKSCVLVESVLARVTRDGVDPSRVLVLCASRRAAAELRDRVTSRLQRTVVEPLARTAHSYAFSLLSRAAVAMGEPPPRLISGPEQDHMLAELLAGHANGVGRCPGWPASVLPALGLRGFRDELRDLLMRALEHGLSPQDLAELGRRHARPEWVSASVVLREYLEVAALASPGAYDPAAILGTAADLLEADDELLRAERERWELVAVDDHHESGQAVARLLDLLVGGGKDLLVTGDPDSSTQTFRGADPGLVAVAADRYRRSDGAPAVVVRLATRWRPAGEVERVTRRVAETIGSVGEVEHRAARSPGSDVGGRRSRDGQVASAVLRSTGQEAAYVAAVLRQAHLLDGVPWSQMAVLVRTTGRTRALRRALVAAGVPLTLPPSEVPLRDEPAVRPLRLALRTALHPSALDPDTAVDLLLSPLGAADALALRRLRQALRAEDRAVGGARSSDALLVEALANPRWLESLPSPTRQAASRVAAVLAAGREAAAQPAATGETVLWALWSSSGLAESWRRQALVGGPSGRRADANLDAVVALFDAAARFVDRLPAAGPPEFLEHLEAQDVPADTLAESAPDGEAVSLLTPQTAAGREWDLVVLVGLQEGVWPDLRLRGSLLGAQALADLLTGRGVADAPLAAARRQVLADERRLLHVAASRARHRLVATAVRDADERPSPFLDLVDPLPDDGSGRTGEGDRQFGQVPRMVSLAALVAELRQVLLTADGASDATGRPVTAARRAEAARQLARLAAARVPGAHPDDWYGLSGLSDAGPLREADASVRVSPSKVEAFGRCPLRWLLETSGGTPGDSTAQTVGNLVHEIAAEAPSGTVQQLTEMLEERWSRLGLPDTWVSARERARAEAMLRRLAAYVAANRRQLVAVEQDFSVDIGRAALRGRVDRLERDRAGRLVVVDLKTGSTRPTKAEVAEHAQLGTYQAAVEAGAFAESGTESGGAALVQVGGTSASYAEQQQEALAGTDDPDWALRRVLEAADGMAGAAFEAVAGDLCRTCPVQAVCPLQPTGRQVGEQ